MVRFGTIIGIATGVLLLGATGAGLWYWNAQNTPAGGLVMVSGPAGAGDSDSALAQRVSVLHDSLQALDARLRMAQLSDSEPPSDLVQAQAGLWERYTWARTRLSEAVDQHGVRPVAVVATADQTPAPAEPADSAAATTPSSTPSNSDLGVMLGHLATYLWVLAGLGAAAVAILAWLLLFRRPREAPSRPLTEPTMRHDRQIRMPVASGDDTQSRVREPTFTQMRQARNSAPAELDDDIPAAPMPRTGRHAWENTVSQPQPQMAPSEPTAVQDYVVSMAKRGRTPAEIARRLRIPQDQVDLILKLRRNS